MKIFSILLLILAGLWAISTILEIKEKEIDRKNLKRGGNNEKKL